MNARRLTTVLAAVSGAIAAVLGVLGLTVAPVALLVALPFGVAAYLLRGQAIEAAAYERAEFRRRATAAVDARLDRGVDGLGGRDGYEGRERVAASVGFGTVGSGGPDAATDSDAATEPGWSANLGAGVGPDEGGWSASEREHRRRRRGWRAAADAAAAGRRAGAGRGAFGATFGSTGGPRADGRARDSATGTDGVGLSAAAARELLDVGPDADQAAIRRAYRERAKELHPDQGGDEDSFRELTRAYDRLRA